MGRARKLWKWTAAVVAGLLVFAGAAVGVLRVWIEHSATFAPAVVARVERASGLRLEFSRLDARLGLYGPELVFRDARLYAPGEREPLATAGAGRVGADWWRMLRTGRLAAGRVTLDGARLHVLVTASGLELRAQGPLWRRLEDEPLRLDRLPMGRVQIDEAMVLVEDTRTRAAPVQLDDVELEVERDSRRLTLTGAARLPRSLGSRLAVNATVDGELEVPDTLAWRADLVVRAAEIAGWAALAPDVPGRPAAGRGDVRLDLRGRGRELASAVAGLDLRNVALRTDGATPPVVYARLGGEFALERAGGTWRVSGRGVNLDPGHDAWRNGQFEAEAELRDGVLERARLQAPQVELGALPPLAHALPAGGARDAVLALALRGRLEAVDATLARGAAPREWRVEGGARFTGLGLQAWGRIPGFTGLDGELRGRGAAGTLRVDTRGFTLDLPEYLAAPVAARELAGTFDWTWRPDGWRFAVDDLRAVAPDGRGGGKARLWLPADASSPRLVLDLQVEDLEARGVANYLPTRRFSAGAAKWLAAAFLAGRVPAATLSYAGEMRRFPFRDGGGEFRVDAQLDGLHVHYQDGWADVEGLTGTATFLNQGLTARIDRARVNGLAARDGAIALPDYRDAELNVRAAMTGDVREALQFLQRSPMGPRLGAWFMGVQGRGELAARVALDLPLKRPADRVVEVDGKIANASGRLPGVDDDARVLTGAFQLRNRDVTAGSATGTLLGGAFSVSGATAAGARGERVLTVQAQGRAAAPRLQPLLGITQGEWLDGTVEWSASGRFPRLEWRPDPLPLPRDAAPEQPPQPRESEVRWLPMTVRAESTLAGLAVRLPAPLAKPADEPRALRAEFTIDPGVDAGALAPPLALRAREAVRPTTLVARVQVGRDAAVLAWRRDDAWRFERGAARFGGGTPALRDGSGVWLDGRVPDLDLSAWLRVKLTAGAEPPARDGGAARARVNGAPAAAADGASGINALLRGGTVSADRFAVLGYAFPDVTLRAENRDGAWRASVAGPAAQGSIVVPWELRRGEPLVLDLDRLVLRDPPAGKDAPASSPSDPRDVPALRLTVRNLELEQRRFGSLQAEVARVPGGLRLERGTLTGPSHTVSASGGWTVDEQGSTTRLVVEANSTDVRETLTAWGFAPTLTGKSGALTAELSWPGGPEGNVLQRLDGRARISLQDGQLLNVASGAGRVLGLLSVSALPRRLSLDFTDLTGKGFAYDTITGDFEFRGGDAHTKNLLLKSPAAEIGVVGRTGLVAHDYDQTAVVAGHFGGPLAAAGALAAGPAVGAALLLFSALFDEPLSEVARGYYRITGSWDRPKVERIGAGAARAAERVGDAR